MSLKRFFSIIILPAITAVIFSSQIFGMESSACQKNNIMSLTPNTANILEWIEDHSGSNLCGGYYSEPIFVAKYPIPPAFKTVPTKISAKNETFFLKLVLQF